MPTRRSPAAALARLCTARVVGATLLAVVLVGVAVRLGIWQYDAFGERRAAQARELSTEQPRPLDEVLGPDEPFPGDAVGAPVVVSGTWLGAATFVVGEREQDGRNGSWVVTPLATSGPAGSALLVVRGWLPQGDPVPPPPRGKAELVAWLQPGEGAGLPDDDPTDDVLPELRIADALQRVDTDLYGAYAVVADRAAPGSWPAGEAATNPGTEGLRSARSDQLPQPGRFTAARNLFYALEWWVFAAFACFVWWRFVRDELALESAAAGDVPDQDAVGVESSRDGGSDPVPSDA